MSLEVGFGPDFDALSMLAARRAVDDTVRVGESGVRQSRGVDMSGFLARVLFPATVIFLMTVLELFAQADPRAIIDQVDRIMRGDSSHGIATMQVVTKHWERRMTLEIWSLGTDYSLVRLRAPKKEAGIATLMAEDNIWNYLPKVDRTIKIPASMMGGSWMGSHFTNDDLVKQSRLVDDYDIEIAFEGDEPAGVPVWEFLLTPKPDAAVVWGSIKFQVRKSDFMPLWTKYYDEDGELSRTMEYSDFRELGGRLLPVVMQVYPANKPLERTKIINEELEFDIELDQSFFSLRNLKKGK